MEQEAKIQKGEYVQHPSVQLLNSDQLISGVTSPVSSKPNQLLTPKSLIDTISEMGIDGSPINVQKLLSLYTRLEKRVQTVEAELSTITTLLDNKTRELLNVRQENAGLQSEISQLLASADAESSSSLAEDSTHSSVSPSLHVSPMLTGNINDSNDPRNAGVREVVTSDTSALAPPSDQHSGSSGIGSGDAEVRPNPCEDFIPLHNLCEARGKKLFHGLKSLIHQPNHATTLLLGDSLAHHLNKKEVDPDKDTFRVRSVGGLCVNATVQALRRHNQIHPKIKLLIYSLGTNDHLHRANHCHEETQRYFQALWVESKRIFPNAKISFVLPYKGMRSLDNQVIKALENVLKENCPKIKRYFPPSMHGKVDAGGVHPDLEGRKIYTEFYSNRFAPRKQKIFSKVSGRQQAGVPYAQAHLTPEHNAEPREPQTSGVPASNSQYVGADRHGAVFRVPQPSIAPHPQQQLRPNQVAWDIADAVTRVLLLHGSDPTHLNMQQPWR